MLKDDDEDESGGKDVPVLGIEAVGVGIFGPVAIASILTNVVLVGRLAPHVVRIIGRGKVGEGAVYVIGQRVISRVDPRVHAARDKV